MFAAEAYSLHAVALMAATIICVLSGAILLGLVAERLHKRPLFWMASAMFLFLSVFAVVRFVLLIAPTQTIYHAVRKVQAVAGVLSAAAPLLVLFALIIRKYSASLIFWMAVISFLNAAGAVAVLQTEPLSGVDFCPAASFFAFYGFYLWSSQNLFPELSVASPEAFLKGLDDLILVFGSSNRLMKANHNAKDVFHPHEGMAREEFDAVLKKTAAVHEDKTIAFITPSGRRYYQQSETIVKKRGGALLATVLMFSDVTEMTVLKSELNDRNERLKAQGKKLEAYINTGERLEAEEQKEMVVREIEQVIGQKMERLTQEMESGEASKNLPRIIETCRDIMTGVRLAVSGLIKTEEGDDRNN